MGKPQPESVHSSRGGPEIDGMHRCVLDKTSLHILPTYHPRSALTRGARDFPSPKNRLARHREACSPRHRVRGDTVAWGEDRRIPRRTRCLEGLSSAWPPFSTSIDV